MKVSVTSRSFSKNESLRSRLLEKYPSCQFNDDGLYFDEERLIDFLKDSDLAIIGTEKITQNVLKNLPNLKTISKYGVGTDNIDFKALSKFNIKWSFTPGTNKTSVAELSLQMMLTLIRKSHQSQTQLKIGKWSPHYGNNLSGKRVGILGLGHVGMKLSKLLAPFSCELSYCDLEDKSLFSIENKITKVSLKDLFLKNDIVSIHIPYNSNNHLLIGDDLLRRTQDQFILINTSRGNIVDEQALINKLKKNQSFSAGFDVFSSEPDINEELLMFDNFYGTPHIGGSTVESIMAMGEAAINGLETAKLYREEL